MNCVVITERHENYVRPFALYYKIVFGIRWQIGNLSLGDGGVDFEIFLVQLFNLM